MPDARIATFAVLAMLTGVGSWFRQGGRLGKRERVDHYTQLVMQCVGVAPTEPVRQTRAPQPGRHA